MNSTKPDPTPQGAGREPIRVSITGPPTRDLATIEADAYRALKTLISWQDAIEIRAPGYRESPTGNPVNLVHRFAPDDYDAAARLAAKLSGKAPAVYVVMAGVDPELPTGRVDTGATSKNIRRYQWLLVDCDPVRIGICNATDAQKAEAARLVEAIREGMKARGWAGPMRGDSGNGFHLLYRIDLDVTAESSALVRSVLNAMGDLHDIPGAKVDRKVFDPPRLVKLYGTYVDKTMGANVGAKGADARYSAILGYPEEHEDHEPCVGEDQLRTFIADATAIVGRRKADETSKAPVGRPNESRPAAGPKDKAKKGEIVVSDGSRWTPEARATAYAISENTPPAISGQGGHDQTFDVACHVGPGFDLPEPTALRILLDYYNPRCQPEWSVAEMTHKVTSAYEKEGRRGWMLEKDRKGKGPAKPQLGIVKPPDTETAGDLDRRTPIVIEVAEMGDVVDRADAALEADDDIFARGPFLVRILPFIGRRRRYQPGRVEGTPIIAMVEAPTLAERLSRYTVWFKPTKNRNGQEVLVPCLPPSWAISALLARKAWTKVRHLSGVVEAPTIRPDGSVIDKPGWDEETGLLYAPNGTFLPVPERPSLEDAKAAAKFLLDLVSDFPFADARHKVVWLAALLTLIARWAIDGPVPMTVFDANTPASGKSKLCHLIAIIFTGRPMATTTYPATNEEMEKILTAVALAGDLFLLFDNIANGGSVGCAALDKAVTSTSIKGRILGKSETPELPWLVALFASGNNLEMAADALRRISLCRLVSPHERPEERTDFRLTTACACGCEGNILAHTRNHRPELLRAALTILKAHALAGRPAPFAMTPVDFPEWSKVIRTAVAWSTGIDPCDTRKDAIAADKTTAERMALIEGWRRLCAVESRPKLSAAEALVILEEKKSAHPELREVLVGWTRDGKLPSPRVVGIKFGAMHGRVTSAGILDYDISHGTRLWHVRESPGCKVTSGDSFPSHAGENCDDNCNTNIRAVGVQQRHLETPCNPDADDPTPF